MTMASLPMRRVTAVALLVAAAGCSNAGAIGDVLGGVLGGQQQQAQTAQAQGVIRGVDGQAQRISLQLSNGQNVALAYDNRTKVVYQNQLYAVSNLESGDQVILRVHDVGNQTYYTDSIHVTQSVQTSGGGSGSSGSANVQTLQGTVRQIDRANGLFTIDAGNVVLTVSMPYGATRADVTRFQNLRTGEQVRFYGVFLNNNRVELRQFY
jgi:Cu/Ag efflux protein CusF